MSCCGSLSAGNFTNRGLGSIIFKGSRARKAYVKELLIELQQSADPLHYQSTAPQHYYPVGVDAVNCILTLKAIEKIKGFFQRKPDVDSVEGLTKAVMTCDALPFAKKIAVLELINQQVDSFVLALPAGKTKEKIEKLNNIAHCPLAANIKLNPNDYNILDYEGAVALANIKLAQMPRTQESQHIKKLTINCILNKDKFEDNIIYVYRLSKSDDSVLLVKKGCIQGVDVATMSTGFDPNQSKVMFEANEHIGKKKQYQWKPGPFLVDVQSATTHTPAGNSMLLGSVTELFAGFFGDLKGDDGADGAVLPVVSTPLKGLTSQQQAALEANIARSPLKSLFNA